MSLVWMVTPDRTWAEKQTKGSDKANQLIQKRKQLANAEDTGL